MSVYLPKIRVHVDGRGRAANRERLVVVRLSTPDMGAGAAYSAHTDLRPGDARNVAFALLAMAERAEGGA